MSPAEFEIGDSVVYSRAYLEKLSAWEMNSAMRQEGEVIGRRGDSYSVAWANTFAATVDQIHGGNLMLLDQ